MGGVERETAASVAAAWPRERRGVPFLGARIINADALLTSSSSRNCCAFGAAVALQLERRAQPGVPTPVTALSLQGAALLKGGEEQPGANVGGAALK